MSHATKFIDIQNFHFNTMTSIRIAIRAVKPAFAFSRPLSFSIRRMTSAGDAKEQDGVHEHRRIQSKKPLNPHRANINSTIASEIPSVGVHNPPPELISSIDPDYTPKDSVPQDPRTSAAGLGVGEIEGSKFKIEPLRRTGEDSNTMRARLLCSFPFRA
jgi:hypothetical protein